MSHDISSIQHLDLSALPENIRLETLRELAIKIAEAKNNPSPKKVSFNPDNRPIKPAIKKPSPQPSPESPPATNEDTTNIIDSNVSNDDKFNIMGMFVGRSTVYTLLILIVIGVVMYYFTSQNSNKKKKKDDDDE